MCATGDITRASGVWRWCVGLCAERARIGEDEEEEEEEEEEEDRALAGGVWLPRRLSVGRTHARVRVNAPRIEVVLLLSCEEGL
jgi:hypothetical protein